MSYTTRREDAQLAALAVVILIWSLVSILLSIFCG